MTTTQKSFERLTIAEVAALEPTARVSYERWFASWMANGFSLCQNDTFDIETERRDGWGYQLEEPQP